jgi:hypothetical protein
MDLLERVGISRNAMSNKTPSENKACVLTLFSFSDLDWSKGWLGTAPRGSYRWTGSALQNLKLHK